MAQPPSSHNICIIPLKETKYNRNNSFNSTSWLSRIILFIVLGIILAAVVFFGSIILTVASVVILVGAIISICILIIVYIVLIIHMYFLYMNKY